MTKKQFLQLKPGNVIKSKRDHPWVVYFVQPNREPSMVLAADTLRDPEGVMESILFLGIEHVVMGTSFTIGDARRLKRIA